MRAQPPVAQDPPTHPKFPVLPRQEITITTTRLGSGGFSEVRVGFWKKQNAKQKIALKFFSRPGYGDAGFLNEVNALVKLRENSPHPNIVTVYGEVKSTRNLIFAMEYIQGDQLATWLYSNKRNTATVSEQAYKICLGTLMGLIFLHSLGIIHKDIKPENILLDPQLTPKIIDFNLAEILPQGQECIQGYTLAGTPRYASPESVPPCPGAISPRSDIYSFGLVLLLCASGEGDRVHDDIENYSKLFERTRKRKLPPIPNEVPTQTQALILHCLRYWKEDRPSAQEAHDRLEAIIKERFAT